MIFLRCYQNSKWPPEINSKKNLWAQKLKNLKSEIIQILLSHSPPYGDVQVTFSRFYWNSKWMNEWMKSYIAHVSSRRLFRGLNIESNLLSFKFQLSLLGDIQLSCHWGASSYFHSKQIRLMSQVLTRCGFSGVSPDGNCAYVHWGSFKWPSRTNFNILGGAKTQKISLVNFFFNFNTTFLATCECAMDFLKMLSKFKMAARNKLQHSLWAQNF